jgi:hypothetical protein
MQRKTVACCKMTAAPTSELKAIPGECTRLVRDSHIPNKLCQYVPKVEKRNRHPIAVSMSQFMIQAQTGVFSVVFIFARWRLKTRQRSRPRLSVSIDETWKQATLPTGRSSIVAIVKTSGTVEVEVACDQIS